MKIVIIGGGFAGMNLAKSLAHQSNIEVVLVDVNNYHFFPPLIYQVATSFIEMSNISYPFRKMFQGINNVRFFNGTLLSVAPESKTIVTNNGTLSYDYLVLAHGAETNFFGMENVKKHALPLKNINDALAIRNTLLLNLEKACREKDPIVRQQLLTLVICGGGPTGVEVAGMLAEMNKFIKSKDYPELENTQTKIYLIDATSSLLSAMSIKSQAEAYKQLEQLGVNIILSNAVKDYDNHIVYLANGETIASRTLIWGSGIIAHEVEGLPEGSTGRGRRILVDQFNCVSTTQNIFAIGDICLQTSDTKFPNGHPQLAQVAIQQGKLLAKNLIKIEKGQQNLQAFAYHDKGSMAIISKFKAVVDLPKGFFKGFLAWMVWLFIHIIPIAGFRNKAKLFFSWIWSFITNDPTLRLIVRSEKDKDNIVA
jgi:NADH dehydrogenase